MSSRRRFAVPAILAFFVSLLPAAVYAQATRTWVSGIGDDANPCSRTAPCKTFAGAISKTAAFGEINVLDPGGYGAVTITKSITIDGTGTFASILHSGVNGIIVNAGATDRVVLRGLQLNGAGPGGSTGINGIRVLQAASVHVEDCVIQNVTTVGIDDAAGGTLVVRNTTIRGAGVAALSVAPGSASAIVVLEDVRLTRNGIGLRLVGNVTATGRRLLAAGNTGAGIDVDTAPAELSLADSSATANAVGIQATNGGLVRTGEVMIAGNTAAFSTESGGAVVAFSGSLVSGNPAAGTAGCEIAPGMATVSCVDGSTACPDPVCPAPVVEIQRTLGPCKKCRTRKGVTTCAGCGIALE